MSTKKTITYINRKTIKNNQNNYLALLCKIVYPSHPGKKYNLIYFVIVVLTCNTKQIITQCVISYNGNSFNVLLKSINLKYINETLIMFRISSLIH